jgi:hypothetical protein
MLQGYRLFDADARDDEPADVGNAAQEYFGVHGLPVFPTSLIWSLDQRVVSRRSNYSSAIGPGSQPGVSRHGVLGVGLLHK